MTMDVQETTNQYHMPPLSDEFLYQIIFCMEDQANDYSLDLETGLITEHVFIEERKKQHPNRFLDLPEWLPSDGFRTMEKFVSTLRNPIYRERLHQVLQSGKGVFRQFKDVLRENSTLERLWYYYKDKEIRRRVFLWYERNDEAFRLSRLGEEAPEDDSSDLVKEDFSVTSDITGYEEAIEHLANRILSNVRKSKNELLYNQIKTLYEEKEHYFSLIVLSSSEDFVGFLQYSISEDSQYATIHFYAIEEHFQGLGVFKYLFNALASHLQLFGIEEIYITLSGDSLRIESMFDVSGTKCQQKVLSISLSSWHTDALEQKDFSYE